MELTIKYLMGTDNKNQFIPSVMPSTFPIRLAELTKEENTTYRKLVSHTSFTRMYIYEWIETTLPSV